MRRVLFDEDMPRKLPRDLPDFVVRTVQEESWGGIANGELLRRAAAGFVTADQNIRFQQNVSRFEIGIVGIETFDTTLANLRRVLPQIKTAIETVTAGTLLIVEID